MDGSTFTSSTEGNSTQPLRPVVAAHLLHRPLDDVAPVGRGVDDVVAARVYGDVGYRVGFPGLLEEHEVSGKEVGLRDTLPHPPLFDRVVGERQPLAEDRLGKTRAVLRAESLARQRRRMPVRGAYVGSRSADHL